MTNNFHFYFSLSLSLLLSPPSLPYHFFFYSSSTSYAQIISEVYLMSHLRGQKHQEMLANLHPSPSSSSSETNPDVIVEASEEHQGPPSEQPEVLDRIKTGKKRAKKLRHRMASRSKEQEGGGTLQTQQQQVTTGTGSSGSSPATQTKHRAK